MNITLPAQALNVFIKKQDDGSATTNGDFRSIPANKDGATRAYFTGLDLTPEAITAIKTLAKPAVDKNNNKYLACGTVTAECEVLAVRLPQETDQQQEIAYRVRVLKLERATDAATGELAGLLG